MAEKYIFQSPYAYAANNPIKFIDYMGLGPDDWVEGVDGEIYWNENVTSANDEDLKEGETYLGKNVLVGTHNRDESGNEEINSADFELNDCP